jgi:hypothetical protein
MLFAEGDDGLEYLQDRLARRLRDVTDSGVIRVVEMMNVDHAMNRSWQRSIVFALIADELGWILGAADNNHADNRRDQYGTDIDTSRSPAA